MIELAIFVVFTGGGFFIFESSCSTPNLLRATVFVSAAIEGLLCLAFRI